ncbi:MAG TPA: glycoside hydrolase family 3 C-terminal domain-containing protein [Lachnospiraceae bacterium]|nr:glycoside hydrolase family 3 C-terminal domain-containing protein [Lachnospiraceae bacterium]
MGTGHFVHSGTLQSQPSMRELKHRELAKKAAVAGIVLLKNDGVLPFHESTSIALLGNGAGKTVKGGIGSGDVNNRENISIYKALKEAGVCITSEDWVNDYDQRYNNERVQWKQKILDDVKKVDNPFDAYASNPFSFPDGRPVTATDIDGAAMAIYVISRISGEGKDRRKAAGDYYLSEREQEDILYLNEQGIPLVLMINAGGPVELTDILAKAKNVRALLNISQLGQEGGYAVADILLGKSVPSGKLTTTWAKRYEDYPFATDYSYLNGDLEKEEYKEGIYVGYRYFDSFGVEPLFPFGYGLSYTSFEMQYNDLEINSREIKLKVLVKNTGANYAGKAVVQSYMTFPKSGVEKEYHRLVGFAKTSVLAPQTTEIVKITIDQKQLASFVEEMNAWIIEAGTYEVWIGEDSASLEMVALLTVPEQVVVEKTNVVCPSEAAFQDLEAPKISENEAPKWIRKAKEVKIPEIEFIPRVESEKNQKEAKIVNVESTDKLIPLLYGNITDGTSTLGAAGIRVPGSAGETTHTLWEEFGVRPLVMADGPAGLRLQQNYEVDRKTDTVYGLGVLGSLENGYLEQIEYHEGADLYYQYCTAFPVGTALAQTWDVELLKEFGEAVAIEMEEFHVDLWLAPGLNIHRNPLCGRNFEYFSEDPLVSGMMAAAITLGVQSRKGCGVTIKHLACNNQEDNRMGVDSCVSERALREIYVRGFEIAVKRSAPVAIMSSYNLINGVHAANSKDLCTTLVRDEWGFEGLIMSDWSTTLPEDGSIPWKCVAAGNDIIMPGNQKDSESIRQAYKQGILSEEEIRTCAGRILEVIRKLDSR